MGRIRSRGLPCCIGGDGSSLLVTTSFQQLNIGRTLPVVSIASALRSSSSEAACGRSILFPRIKKGQFASCSPDRRPCHQCITTSATKTVAARYWRKRAASHVQFRLRLGETVPIICVNDVDDGVDASEVIAPEATGCSESQSESKKTLRSGGAVGGGGSPLLWPPRSCA